MASYVASAPRNCVGPSTANSAAAKKAARLAEEPRREVPQQGRRAEHEDEAEKARAGEAAQVVRDAPQWADR